VGGYHNAGSKSKTKNNSRKLNQFKEAK